MNDQPDLFPQLPRRRARGTDAVIDWDTVSGIDLANDPVLAARWARSSECRSEVRRLRKFSREAARNPKGTP